MAIRAFLPDSTFDPETISVMGRALERARSQLRGETSEVTKEAIAILIIAAARAGERDEERLVAAGLRFEPRRQADSTERRAG